LFKVGGIYDKDGGAVLARVGRSARISEYVDHGLHLWLLRTDEQRDVAPSQEATGAGDTGHAVTVGDQLFNHRPGIYVMDDRDDQFHLSLASQLLKSLDVDRVHSGAAYLCFDQHRLDFEQGGLDVGRDKPSAGVAALAHVFQQA
jgi:hypothetical protein